MLTNAHVFDMPTIYQGTFSNNVLFFANLTGSHAGREMGQGVQTESSKTL